MNVLLFNSCYVIYGSFKIGRSTDSENKIGDIVNQDSGVNPILGS